MKAQSVLKQLSTEDKICLCSGKDFWHLTSFPILNIPEIMVSDGPHGLRKQVDNNDVLGFTDSMPATCFPTASCSASSWDKSLLNQMGQVLATEAIAQKVSVILGPGANIKRNPLCGRNFEYFSEDPILSGYLAASFIQGVQSLGVGTSLKHFAGNNQELNRMNGSSNIDQRALNEIYLKSFELAVKLGKPWTVMCSYNKINGVYSSSNPWLLTQVLRNDWHFKGLVMSDWGAGHQREIDLKAGLDLEMPGNHHFYLNQVKQAIEQGTLKIEELDRCALRVLELIDQSTQTLNQQISFDQEAHHNFARKVAQESIVLLKNKDHILPLDPTQPLLVIGELAHKARFQGSGSSQVHPYRVESFLDGLNTLGCVVNYKKGYDISKGTDTSLIQDAIDAIQPNQNILVFIGLTEDYESEGFDRVDCALPLAHNALIQAVLTKTKNVIVILAGGAPVELPWANDVAAIINGYLPGEAGGPALADVVFGQINPSGKLAETYPLTYDSLPMSKQYGKERKQVNYRESIFVGYRYFDSAHVEVLYPFGHGLSYTNFEYKDLSFSENVVSFTLTNIGDRAGAEIIQIYLSNRTQANFFAAHELKAFDKIYLKAKESKVIHIGLDESAFQYYDLSLQRTICAAGAYELQVASSSRDIRLRLPIQLKTSVRQHIENAWRHTWYGTLVGQPSDQDFEFLMGQPTQKDEPIKKGDFTLDSSIEDMKRTPVGKMMKTISIEMLRRQGHYSKADMKTNNFKMMMSFLISTPLRSTVLLSQGALSQTMALGIVDLANGHPIKGLKNLLKKESSV